MEGRCERCACAFLCVGTALWPSPQTYLKVYVCHWGVRCCCGHLWCRLARPCLHSPRRGPLLRLELDSALMETSWLLFPSPLGCRLLRLQQPLPRPLPALGPPSRCVRAGLAQLLAIHRRSRSVSRANCVFLLSCVLWTAFFGRSRTEHLPA